MVGRCGRRRGFVVTAAVSAARQAVRLPLHDLHHVAAASRLVLHAEVDPLGGTEEGLHSHDGDLDISMIHGIAGDSIMLERHLLAVTGTIPPDEVTASCGFRVGD